MVDTLSQISPLLYLKDLLLNTLKWLFYTLWIFIFSHLKLLLFDMYFSFFTLKHQTTKDILALVIISVNFTDHSLAASPDIFSDSQGNLRSWNPNTQDKTNKIDFQTHLQPKQKPKVGALKTRDLEIKLN